jgi:hypothetical protein
MESKFCRWCNTEKPKSEMIKNKSYADGYATVCKQCSKEYSANLRKNKDYIIKSRAKKYKTTVEHITHLYETQTVCQICKQEDKRRNLAIDHCHSTDKVRGLLCDACNKAIGHFKDNIEYLENAIEYLKKYT